MAEIRWSAEAELWLKEIHEYIAQDNPSAAANVVLGIYDRAQVLSDHPEIGYKHQPSQNRNIRVLLYGHYRIAYLVKESGNIDILGVFHSSMEMQRYLL